MAYPKVTMVDFEGRMVPSFDDVERVRLINIERGQEYRRKLASGEIKRYTFVDVRPGGGVQDRNKPKTRNRERRAELKARHLPARDHAQARALNQGAENASQR